MRTPTFFSAWSSDDIIDVIFENRNKSYGAYDLRKHYNERLRNAFFITLSMCLLLFGIQIVYSKLLYKKPNIPDLPFGDPTVFQSIDKIIIEPPKHPEHTSSSHKDVPTFIDKDTLVSNQEKKDSIPDNNSTTSANDGLKSADTSSGGPLTNTGAGVSTTNQPDVADGAGVTTIPSIWPSFPGGQKALNRYLQIHLHCSQLSQNVTGKLYLGFVITKEGMVTDVKIIKDNVGYGCSEEAARVLQHMPQWIPGLYNNRPVNVKMVIPISFESSE